MKGFIKKLICFVGIITVVIGTATYAGTLVKKVYFSAYPIYIDGEEYASESPILLYQDRTYVSLREFSNMVGVNIDFRDDTIYLETNNKIDSKLLENDASFSTNTKTETDEKIIEESESSSSKVTVVFEDEADSQIVYITASGTKYHSSKNCSSANTFYSISLKEAKKRGYLPCSKCVNNL